MCSNEIASLLFSLLQVELTQSFLLVLRICCFSQFGEYFGASLTTNDVNTDGFDDLLVGAPLHSTLKQADEGRVYLYMGGKNMVISLLV